MKPKGVLRTLRRQVGKLVAKAIGPRPKRCTWCHGDGKRRSWVQHGKGTRVLRIDYGEDGYAKECLRCGGLGTVGAPDDQTVQHVFFGADGEPQRRGSIEVDAAVERDNPERGSWG